MLHPRGTKGRLICWPLVTVLLLQDGPSWSISMLGVLLMLLFGQLTSC
jgi:hypothetical protein